MVEACIMAYILCAAFQVLLLTRVAALAEDDLMCDEYTFSSSVW